MLRRDKVDQSYIRRKAEEEGVPVVDFLLRKMKELEKVEGRPSTLFAACPNSETVIKAALRSAKRANAPIKFAATLNQVDEDGGYTGLTQSEFVEMVKIEAEAISYEGLIIVALDHGGPWLKDQHSIENWSLEETMTAVKKSLEAAIDAGYDFLHIDPTVDKTLSPGEIIPIERVAERTIELIKHAENYRREKGIAPLGYEVGTEEVHGGLANLEVFDRFLSLLREGLEKEGLSEVWPILIVGKVGTDLHTTIFDPEVAKTLAEKAAKYGSFIKGHYTDYVENPEEYPLSGMGAANVGPEFTEEEYNALTQLAQLEDKLKKEKLIARSSLILQVLEKEVYESNRWQKWLKGEEKGKDLYDLSPSRQKWLIKTGCRYIWAQPRVVASRTLLYRNLEQNGYRGEEMVLLQVERAMDKYFRTFNLIDLHDRLKKVVE
ncbi:MAG TPA: class II D-tagatose-bisphosphate aldolase, non-catalytic subunit [Candidatus Atribacteria bacterium]|nr:class II D-tagatose-bisphosphate aldolase, non-catalytic subunit [Candidatus Atribacteria bacterium]